MNTLDKSGLNLLAAAASARALRETNFYCKVSPEAIYHDEEDDEECEGDNTMKIDKNKKYDEKPATYEKIEKWSPSMMFKAFVEPPSEGDRTFKCRLVKDCPYVKVGPAREAEKDLKIHLKKHMKVKSKF